MTRSYQMIRIEAGDYLLPSNDAQALWRIVSYEEDGSAGFKGRFWNAWRFNGTITQAQHEMDLEPDCFLGWDRWVLWESALPTRKAAVDAALRTEERMGVAA